LAALFAGGHQPAELFCIGNRSGRYHANNTLHLKKVLPRSYTTEVSDCVSELTYLLGAFVAANLANEGGGIVTD
jgi:hypothetical protein